MSRFMSGVALATAVMASAALVSFAPVANAATYALDGNFNGTIIDLDIIASGSDITGISVLEAVVDANEPPLKPNQLRA